MLLPKTKVQKAMNIDQENDVPINDEEGREASSRDPEDTTLGPVDETGNKDAGELEAWQHAYDASTPSYELKLDEERPTENKENKGNNAQNNEA